MCARELLERRRIGSAWPPLEIVARLRAGGADLASRDVGADLEQRESLRLAFPSRQCIGKPAEHAVGMRGELAFEVVDARSGGVLRSCGGFCRRRFGRRTVRAGGLGSHSSGRLWCRWRFLGRIVDGSRAGSQEVRGECNGCREREERGEARGGASSWFRRGGRRQRILRRSTSPCRCCHAR